MEDKKKIEDITLIKQKKKNKKMDASKLVTTFFRNALRSNLDLTSLADTKAGILISINGFILTVSVTASSFAVHNTTMNYAFISIILTSLGSIIFAVLAVKPRNKNKFVSKEHLSEYSSLLYYQDIADLKPTEYIQYCKASLKSTKKSTEEMLKHLHIIGAEIKKKYFWLKQAYTYFSIGLIVSATLMVYSLTHIEQTAFYNLSNGNVMYQKSKFYNIFEPSGATTLEDGRVLIVEDEKGDNNLKLLSINENGTITEDGKLHLTKELKKVFKHDVEDIEAITSNQNNIYAITSHSLNRNSQTKESREKMIMMTYNGTNIEKYYLYSHLKNDLYYSFPNLFSHSVLKANDINIEGLVYDEKDDSLLVGFRSPLKDGKAIIIGIKNFKSMFLKQEKTLFTQATLLNLNGMGIRDISYDSQKKGYWIIAGSSQQRNGTFQLWFWDKEDSKLLFVKHHPNIGFGEGITLINKDSKNPGLLVVEDDGHKPNKPADYLIINRNSL